ncbi:50S ribosomal protein L6 [Helicobacter sp. MIT 03-1614]|jgi:large subunit ribosomal protein L6|uniref:Large ribosomal subunit protein uL6 n=1 Tax=Helicobacter hepaticus (strain ATCC 51449 / 3B1) TaxID=235279 RepID=RL6_HELHP|nr:MULTISPECIES: 50S ribosomal protein L6 [Helicobacter]Q7VGC9.1 RecName: Full=Large ribosomal subunit protein uL6; AltName: Full=50S ribosomal protein L6 [Helicobacter hepaticus ATCC 51449]AAP77990.1 ribosomal protein L6 [Helicobacter hepaticus ATCC 51449]TLD87197.1 50S ribosomal protein L6 [Helicobacter sp. MIT 03-1614]
MSRVGKKPINIPKGVEVSVQGSKILFKGAKEQKELETYGRVQIHLQDGTLSFACVDSQAQSRAYWGTYRALANNIIVGLSQGFTKVLEINGVGYKANISGKNLEMALGFSHPVIYPIPAGVEMSVDKNTITIKGADKQQIGQIAAEIRKFRPPEPYKGKGIKYSDEMIVRKAGKTSKK